MEIHEYLVVCNCGMEVKRKDNNLDPNCVLVRISWCRECCPDCAGIPNQLYYDIDGGRLE